MEPNKFDTPGNETKIAKNQNRNDYQGTNRNYQPFQEFHRSSPFSWIQLSGCIIMFFSAKLRQVFEEGEIVVYVRLDSAQFLFS